MPENDATMVDPANRKVHYMSLGKTCQAAAQVRRYHQVESAGVLDWLITPHKAVIDLINNNFEMELSESEIERQIVGSEPGVVHRKLQISFVHDYNLETDLSFSKDVSRVSEKYKFLAQRACQSIHDSDFVVLVSHGSALWECKEIQEAFAHKYPGKKFGILATHELGSDASVEMRNPQVDEGIILVGLLPATGEHAWAGSLSEWDRAFQYADKVFLNKAAVESD